MSEIDSKLNHSAAHLLAAAVVSLYPGVKLGVGPATEDGFFYDFLFPEPLSSDEMRKIEKMMKKLADSNLTFRKVSQGDVTEQPFKTVLLQEITERGETASFYELVKPDGQVVFSDLCAGPHVSRTGEIKHFKLLTLGAVNWRGEGENKLTRIYGVAFATAAELSAYLEMLELRQTIDHRKLGRELGIFEFNNLAGQGLPAWLPNGQIVKNEIKKFLRSLEEKYGFNEVSTPALVNAELFVKSGHLAHYRESMFPIMEVDGERLVLRPMTCPQHILIYASTRRSYRDLPIRLSEHSQLYRYEKSGALIGLERVRSMELTDGHVFCRLDQIAAEITNAYRLIMEALSRFNIKVSYVSLSRRDTKHKEKYDGDDSTWEKAEEAIRQVLRSLGVEFKELEGEAAFYGPKIDIQVKTILGHDITLSTIQLDFTLPMRFGLSYTDSKEKQLQPIMIHRGLIGTYERFISILLEQTRGNLPLWLAPVQVIIIPVLPAHQAYADKINEQLHALNYRVEMDARDERLSRKIHDAQTRKIQFQLVLGDQEVANQNVTVRTYGDTSSNAMTLTEFLQLLARGRDK